MIAAVGQSQMTDEQKSQKFAEAYKVLTDLNYSMLNSSFEKIITPDGTAVIDKEQIKEFIANANMKIDIAIAKATLFFMNPPLFINTSSVV